MCKNAQIFNEPGSIIYKDARVILKTIKQKNFELEAAKKVELVSKELNHLAAILHVYAGGQRYTYRVLQTISMKLILLWVWAERAVLGRAKSALKFKY